MKSDANEGELLREKEKGNCEPALSHGWTDHDMEGAERERLMTVAEI